ncbi:phage tail protein [Salmonella enterica subsp. enterica serovar 4,[5],12:i:-]|uniref:Phage tail protein n=2 Tax=Salmonella enterica TaxID=28901 RepID=A0A3V4YFR0_SALET|nr:phage tail protein [Salmonella enterica subsp. enterica serovar 4,[5],12:i:-]EAM6726491.1 phage tail protein [Salmonella enterica]EBO2065768.1 phage tail protein [Salmonella enterica subsp. enterica serovar Derby]ECN0690416.1 phage tail protein [Salmonella enterica subsp. enterica serovar Typhimurium]EDQ7097059.1 phage tail protein [Salmonella enterica subsp. enterica serovar 4,12:i:-]EDS2409430.1 phage tail protein [Salmonella enterica subsp. enterica]EDU7375467.1 phage tail protein [Salm
MNDVTVVTSVTYPSPESLALVADVQYHEPYLSAALNRKFRGIVDPGFYAGFLPKPGGGMNLLITSVDGDKTAGAASVDIGEFYQVTIQHRKDISLALSAGKKYAIVLKGRYLLGEDTYQVNTASHIHAAEFVARTYTDSYQLGDGELLVCTVNIPAGVSAITQEMIDTSERINRTIGIDISDSVTSSRSDVAASSLAVKKAYDLAKSKYTAQDASTTQKGLVQLSSATNSDSETMAATPKAVKSIKDLADTKAPIESPSLTGTPTAPTAAQGTNSTQIANTAFVKAAITALINGAPGTLDTLKEIAAAINNDPNYSTTINNALALKAPLASPALTGVPTAPTAAQGTNNTQIATTAYVRAAISALVGSSPEALDTLNELAAALGNDPNFATTMTNALAGKQPLDATLTALAGLATGANKLPYFTGTDTVSQTDLTSVGRDILAKTSVLAVIQYLGLGEGSALPVGVPVPWPSATPPTGWLKCNGAPFSAEEYPKLAKVYPTNELPDLRGEFIRGWDDGRGIDAGREILSAQGDAIRNITGTVGWYGDGLLSNVSGVFSGRDRVNQRTVATDSTVDTNLKYASAYFDASTKVPTATENRPRNIAFNFIVRAA